jgi:hypothetical protein
MFRICPVGRHDDRLDLDADRGAGFIDRRDRSLSASSTSAPSSSGWVCVSVLPMREKVKRLSTIWRAHGGGRDHGRRALGACRVGQVAPDAHRSLAWSREEALPQAGVSRSRPQRDEDVDDRQTSSSTAYPNVRVTSSSGSSSDDRFRLAVDASPVVGLNMAATARISFEGAGMRPGSGPAAAISSIRAARSGGRAPAFGAQKDDENETRPFADCGDGHVRCV